MRQPTSCCVAGAGDVTLPEKQPLLRDEVERGGPSVKLSIWKRLRYHVLLGLPHREPPLVEEFRRDHIAGRKVGLSVLKSSLFLNGHPVWQENFLRRKFCQKMFLKL